MLGIDCVTPRAFHIMILSISKGIVSTKHKRDDFDFGIVYFSFFDGDVLPNPSYDVYIYSFVYSQEHLHMLLTLKVVTNSYPLSS